MAKKTKDSAKFKKNIKTGYKKFQKAKDKTGEKIDDYKAFIKEHPFLAVSTAFFAGMLWEKMFGKR